MKRKILLLAASAMLCSKLYAQKQLEEFVKNMNILDRPSVTYDYKITLLQVQSNAIEDSITGRIYKRSHEYLDSSDVALVAFTGDYLCKLNHVRKEAYVYDLNLLHRKLNKKLDRSRSKGIIIPDSVFSRRGNFRIDTTTSQYICHWQLDDNAVVCRAFVDKKTLRLSKVILEIPESIEDGKPLYKRLCTIYNIKNEFPASVITLDRFCRINGNRIILNRKYAAYNLKSLLN